MAARVFLGLGSNQGDRLRYLQRAVFAIGRLPGVTVRRISAVYETEPRGFAEQSDFLNAVVEITTDQPAAELAVALKAIELELGRTRTRRWGPREIDIDLLIQEGTLIESDELIVPHRELPHRRFVLEPLAELAPDLVHPTLHLSVLDLLERCTDRGKVVRTQWSLRPKE